MLLFDAFLLLLFLLPPPFLLVGFFSVSPHAFVHFKIKKRERIKESIYKGVSNLSLRRRLPPRLLLLGLN